MPSTELEERLAAARDRVKRETEALRHKGGGGSLPAALAAHEELLDAERAVALANGAECAVPCKGFPKWDIGAPLPHLVYGHGVALAYLLSEPDPNWDGSYVRVADVDQVSSVALVRFKAVTAFRMGSPNDEVIQGHPLYGKGLAAYRPHTVANSNWIKELQKVNAVHSGYNADRWTRKNHYLLTFHDETFECVAEGFSAEVKPTTLADTCRAALEEVMGHE